MMLLRKALLTLAAAAACSVAQAQVPPPGSEPGSVPESQPAPSQSSPAAPSQPQAQPRYPRVSSGVMAGLKIAGDAPVYPAKAKAQGVQGSVILHAIISVEGRVQDLTVVAGNPLLADAAVDAVKTWMYRPYLLNGEPTAVDTTITVNFNLAEPAASPSGYTSGQQSVLPAGRVRISSGVMAGQRTFGPAPVIPVGTSTSGGVVLHAIIGTNGSVESLTPVHGSPELAQAVMGTVKQWQYKPYVLNGEPVEVETTISMNW